MSPPMRGRGLKFFFSVTLFPDVLVAPYAGAWIEILCKMGNPYKSMVAPYAGAWIEIDYYNYRSVIVNVAPYAGAWIEIFCQWIFCA